MYIINIALHYMYMYVNQFTSCPCRYAGTVAPLQHPSVYSDCNVNCSCSTEAYDPVCADGGVQYFNPCLTGCTQAEDKDGQKVALHCIAFVVFYLLCFPKRQ